jgi:hypothetical protein
VKVMDALKVLAYILSAALGLARGMAESPWPSPAPASPAPASPAPACACAPCQCPSCACHGHGR